MRSARGWWKWGAQVAGVAIGAGVIIVALGGVLRVTRAASEHGVIVGRHDPDLPAVTDSRFERLLELYTGTHIDPGHAVVQLANGDGTYPLLWRDLRAAERTITMQMYYAQPGRIADTTGAILADRARAGVRVLLLFDAFGAQELPDSWLDSLRAAGVEVALLRKLRWFTLHGAADRSHVRAVVIDGRIGYTGGFGMADHWFGSSRRGPEWREANVRFEGPAVSALQAAFASAWLEAEGEMITGVSFFADRDSLARGPSRAGVLFAEPTTGSTAAERFLALMIASARTRLYVTNSYFVPSPDYRRLLARAAARGVDVRILTAGAKTDVKTPRLAGRFSYGELLAQGVRIYEYEPAMMHAKTIVVDGSCGTIGSMNFDSRSLAFNNEANLVVIDRRFGAQMDSVFLDDLRRAREITLDDIRRRSLWQRALEGGAMLLSRVL